MEEAKREQEELELVCTTTTTSTTSSRYTLTHVAPLRVVLFVFSPAWPLCPCHLRLSRRRPRPHSDGGWSRRRPP